MPLNKSTTPLLHFFLLYLKVISAMRRPFHTIHVGLWSPPAPSSCPPPPPPPPPPAVKVAPKREGVGVWPIVPTPPGVLAARYPHTRLGVLGQGEALFPRHPALGGKEGYPWHDLCGPLPQLPAKPAMRMRLCVPPGWPWEPVFAHNVVRWVVALRWQDSPGDVTWTELALDCELFPGRALAASPHHQLRGMRLLLGERAQGLRQASRLLQRHMAVGQLLQGAPATATRYSSHRGPLRARPFFCRQGKHGAAVAGPGTTAAGDVAGPAATPARIQPGGATHFLVAYFPRPLDSGPALLPCTRRPRRVHAQGVARAVEQPPQRQGEGRGLEGARCEQHRSPSCRCCPVAGLGVQPLLPRGA